MPKCIRVIGFFSVAVIAIPLGCDTNTTTTECAAPGPLCEPSQDESTTPCEPSEAASCRRIEIQHCSGPWVVYCRPGPSSGGSDAASTAGGSMNTDGAAGQTTPVGGSMSSDGAAGQTASVGGSTGNDP